MQNEHEFNEFQAKKRTKTLSKKHHRKLSRKDYFLFQINIHIKIKINHNKICINFRQGKKESHIS